MATETLNKTSDKQVFVSKRVLIVLSSLVATLTLSSMLLLAMENAPMGNVPPPAFTIDESEMSGLVMPRNRALQNQQWDYIIIYESGDLDASAASLAEGRAKGVGTKPTIARPAAKFHFVVDSASSKRDAALDGELEVTSTWHNQEPGSFFALQPNPDYQNRHYIITNHSNAVGICVSGDISKKPYSESQVRCLKQLVKELRGQLQLPMNHVKFQWELDGNKLIATNAQESFATEFRKQ